MAIGMSITDIAARVALDYSDFMQGMKQVEQRFVDFRKSTASPFYPGSAPDQGAAHVDAYIQQQINAEGKYAELVISNRQKIHIFNKEAEAYRERAAKETEQRERQAAEARFIDSQRVAEMHKQEQQQRAQEAKDRKDASDAIRMRLEREQADRVRLQKQSEERVNTERKVEYILDAQKAKYDEIYAFELKQKAARSEFAALLLRAKSQGTSNTDLTAAATEFRAMQQKEKQQFLADRAVKTTNAELQARIAVVSVLAQKVDKDEQILLLELKQRVEQEKFEESLKRANLSLSQRVEAILDLRRAHEQERDELQKSLNPVPDAHIIAYRTQQEQEAQDVQERSLRLIRSLATAQDLHNERVQEYTNFLRLNLLTQDQFNEAVAQSERVMRSSARGAGAYSGMLAQASFAAEDFIQGIAMGDIRSALLGASNNLTMVARGALDATEGMTFLGLGMKSVMAYAVAIPATVVGAIAAFSYLNRAEADARSLADALRDVERGYDRIQQAMGFRHQASRSKERIADIESMSQAQKEYNETLRRQQEAEEKLTAARARQTRTGSETLINTLGGQEAYNEMQNIINSLIRSGHEGLIQLGKDMAASMSAAMSAAQAGEAEKMINALRSLNELSNSILLDASGSFISQRLNLIINDLSAQDKLEAIFNTGYLMQTEDQTKLNELRDSMAQVTKDMAQAENEMKQATADREQLEQRMAELRKEGLRLSEEEFKEKQRIAEQERQQFAGQIAAEAALLEEKRKRKLFDMTATQQQKDMLDIQEQMREFMGPSAVMPFIPANVIGGGLMGQLMQQNAQAAGMEFLQGQAAMLENEIANLQKASSPEIIGGMQQNAFDAQAEAFKQIFAAANKQPNPQLTALGQKLDAIKTAIQNGGVFQIVQ